MVAMVFSVKKSFVINLVPAVYPMDHAKNPTQQIARILVDLSKETKLHAPHKCARSLQQKAPAA